MRGGCILARGIKQEAFSIRCNIKAVVVRELVVERRSGEQGLWLPRFQGQFRATCDFNGYRHQFGISPQEVQLRSVASPARLVAAINGDSLRFLGRREGAYVDLAASGFVRCIGHPLAVGRELSVSFVELGM